MKKQPETQGGAMTVDELIADLVKLMSCCDELQVEAATFGSNFYEGPTVSFTLPQHLAEMQGMGMRPEYTEEVSRWLTTQNIKSFVRYTPTKDDLEFTAYFETDSDMARFKLTWL